MISTAREVVEESNSTIPLEVTSMIKEFSDVVLKDFLDKLTLMRDNTLLSLFRRIHLLYG